MRPDFIVKSDIQYTDLKTEAELHERARQSTHWNIRNLGSEKSYEDLLSHEQLLDVVAFFTFNPVWQYSCTTANFLLFWIVTYNVYFDNSYEDNSIAFWLKLICNIIIIADIIGAYFHLRWKETRKRAVYNPRPIFFQISDVLSLLAIPIGLVKTLRSQFYLRLAEMFFIVIRQYRIYVFFKYVSSNAGRNTMMNLVLKHLLVFAFIFHTFACLWYHEGLYFRERQLTWVDRDTYLLAVKDRKDKPSPSQLYVLSLLHVVGGVTSVALGGGSTEKNEFEKIILICFMSISMYYLNGMVIGTFTNVCCNRYVRQTQFTNTFKLIVSNMASHNISETFTNKMLDYYTQYWKQEDAVNHSILFDSLPLALRQICLLDKYWFALSQAHLFINLEDGFKRSVACRMTTKMCIPGEVIVDTEYARDSLMYIAKGSVHLLSIVDGESPLITLGVGTCLGEINLIYGVKNSTKVIAATYCTIYILNKLNLWHELLNYRQLRQSKIFHTDSLKMLNSTKLGIEEKKQQHHEDTPLQLIKRTLLNEDEIRLADYTKIHLTAHEKKLSNVYVHSKMSNIYSDGIFINTSWPWIMNPQSAFFKVWEVLIISTIIVESIGYPLEIAYHRKFSTGYSSTYRTFGDSIYVIDIILKLFTAVETPEGSYNTVVEITLQRLATLTFILDLIAVFPFSTLIVACGITVDERLITLIYFHKLVKMYRIAVFVKKLEYNFKLNVSYVRLVKYIMYLLYAAYIFGCAYFMVLCFNEVCNPKMAVASKTEEQFTASVMTAMLIMTGTGGVVDFYTFEEIRIILIISVIGTITVVYLISDYSATLTLASREETAFMEMMNLIRNFIDSNKISQNIQYRMNQYFIAQWLGSRGVDFNALYADAPSQLHEEFQVRKYSKLLTSTPLFHHLNYKIIRRLAMSCELISLPPNEYVTYAGEVQQNVYIIEKGFCEVISGSSQKVDKILGPMGNFGIIESLLVVSAIYNVRTITHVTLIKIRRTTIKECFLMNPDIEKQLSTHVDIAKSSFAARRLFAQSITTIEHEDIEEKDLSWFVFPKSIVHPKHIDFMNGWQNMNVLRYIMMRRTLMPYGQFICYWELSRAIFAFISAMLHPTLHIYQCYIPEIKWAAIILDVFAAVDLYIRMHVCYYNKQGILVTHPRMTAINYFTSSFLMDLLAMFPTDYAIYVIESKDVKQFNAMQAYVRLNRVLQIYRLPDGFSIFSRDIFDQGGIFIIAVKYLLLTFVILNTLAVIITNASIQIENGAGGRKDVTPKRGTSWISSSASAFSFDSVLPINTYMIAVYWVTTTAQQLSFANVRAHSNQEIIFLIFTIVIGFMWFTFIIVIISNNKATINEHLTLYQNHMKRLITFMKQEKIPKHLQTLVIDHFEHIWKRTQGMNVNTILYTCHLALRKDCALFLYEDTFKLVSVFTDMKSAFFRMMGTNINIRYFLTGHTIINLNDIVKTFYIVHKGYVDVMGPDGKFLERLTRGCCFGNLDDIQSIRSMVTIISGSNTDLLTIDSVKFYKLLKNYPVVTNRINKYMLLKNLSYIVGKKKSESVLTGSFIRKDEQPMSRFWKALLTGKWTQDVFLMASLISYIIVSYQLAFRDHSIILFVIAYILDVCHIFKMYLGFNAPYQDVVGDLITDQHLIRQRYLTYTRFYLELAAVLPIELFSLVSTQDRLNIMCILRMNRSLRLWNIFNYFNVNYNYLNINVLGIKMASIAINMILLTHTEACLLCILGTRIEDQKQGWMYNDTAVNVCVNLYLCALYFAVSFTSFAGYINMRPRNFGEITITIFLTLINKLIIAMIIGNMSAIAQSYATTLTDYDYGRTKMELYLKHSILSLPLFRTAMKYTYQLWTQNQGVQIPIFMTLAPNYLKCHIKYAAYGYHIKENLVFMQCHDAFLHLLCKTLQVHMYFTDDIICQQGDVNGTMYFIHRGSVDVFYVSDYEETHVDNLIEKDCFGMIQGLFPNTPHTHTFKSITVTTIASLELKNWINLLRFYPAAKFKIYENMTQLDELSRKF